MQVFPTTREERNEMKDYSRQCAVFLETLSQALMRPSFWQWLNSRETRFDWAGLELHQKLRKDLKFQLDQGTVKGHRNEDISESTQEVTQAAVNEVERLMSYYDVEFTRKETTFKVPRGSTFQQAILELLENAPPTPSYMDLHRPFYLWNSIEALRTYARSRQTLTVDTGHRGFERFLESLKEDYMVAGYPHDILAIDASLVKRPEVVGILQRPEYCSTHCVTKETYQELRNIEGWNYVQM